MKTQNLLTGHLMALVVSTVWGTTFISTKLMLEYFHPVEIIIFRFVLAWLLLFLLSPKILKPKKIRQEWPYMAAGLTGMTLYFWLENTALNYTQASNVGIIISAAPMFSALLLWLTGKNERPRPTFFLGFVIAMAGISVISLSGSSQLELNPLGDLLTLGAALSWGAYGVFLQMTPEDGYTNLQVTRKIFAWGLVFTVPFALFYQLPLSPAPFVQPVMLGNLIYLTVGASAICYILWNKAIIIIGTVATNVYIYFMPVVTLMASALILHEAITAYHLIAIVLILIGLWLSQKK